MTNRRRGKRRTPSRATVTEAAMALLLYEARKARARGEVLFVMKTGQTAYPRLGASELTRVVRVSELSIDELLNSRATSSSHFGTDYDGVADEDLPEPGAQLTAWDRSGKTPLLLASGSPDVAVDFLTFVMFSISDSDGCARVYIEDPGRASSTSPQREPVTEPETALPDRYVPTRAQLEDARQRALANGVEVWQLPCECPSTVPQVVGCCVVCYQRDARTVRRRDDPSRVSDDPLLGASTTTSSITIGGLVCASCSRAPHDGACVLRRPGDTVGGGS